MLLFHEHSNVCFVQVATYLIVQRLLPMLDNFLAYRFQG